MLCYRLIKPTDYKLNCKRLQTSHRNIKICTSSTNYSIIAPLVIKLLCIITSLLCDVIIHVCKIRISSLRCLYQY